MLGACKSPFIVQNKQKKLENLYKIHLVFEGVLCYNAYNI